MIDLEFAELHSPLFFLGKNFGLKLDNNKFRGIKLSYDRDASWLVVGWDNRVTYVPSTNVVNMTPVDTSKPKAAPKAAEKMTAQVSSPTDHVFAGPGGGKR